MKSMSRIIEAIYNIMPYSIKNLMVSTYGFKQDQLASGYHYKKYYLELKELVNKELCVIKEYQSLKLAELLFEGYKYSIYYNNIFNKNDIVESNISPKNALEILSKLPLLEKDLLRNNLDKICSTSNKRPTKGSIHTSGTTGSPMAIEYDSESKQGTKAEWRRYYDWLGLPKKFKSVRFSGRIITNPKATKPPFWVYNIVNKQLFMSTYHLSDNNIDSYIKKLNKYKPEFLDGYPSALYILANFVLKNKITLQFKPVAISTTAETLFDHHRLAIEKAFCCKVYNQYASSEGAPWIVECKLGQPHLWIDTGVFEFMDQSDNLDGTINSELVVTSFRNFKTPLIRYRIGDVVTRYADDRMCTCGSHYPIIHKIIGRQDDILYTKEKGHVGRLDPAYKGLSGIKQSKIIQLTIDKIEVLIVPENGYSENTGLQLLANLQDRLGSDIKINIIKTRKIPLGKNGKFKSVERQFKLEDITL